MGGSNASLLEEIRRTKREITSAHATFTLHFNTFLALGEQLDIKCKEIEDREREVDRREARAKIEDQQLEEREKRCSGKVREVERREGEVKAKEDRWAEMESVMKANAVKLPTVIKLNVSMLPLSTPTLLPYPPAILISLHFFSNQLANSNISSPFLSSFLVLFLKRWYQVLSVKREASPTQGFSLWNASLLFC